jgi:pseudaminic acid synthase
MALYVTPQRESSMRIDNSPIDIYHYPYLVAEISGNHNQNLTHCLQTIAAAKAAGADAVKIQCYTPEDMTLDSDKPDFQLTGTQWQASTLYELYKRNATPIEWWPILFKYAKDNKITLFASIFAPERVETLEKLGCPAYKIASMEAGYTDLLKEVGRTGKPVVLSAGLSSISDIQDAIYALDMEDRHKHLALLHCVSAYPTPISHMELGRIPILQEEFPTIEVGLSSHSKAHLDAVVATSLGATIIEKHFMLDASVPTDDAEFSLLPSEFRTLRQGVTDTYESIAVTGEGGMPAGSLESSRFERSIYVVKDIGENDLFCTENIRVIRPGFSAPPRKYDSLLGQVAGKAYSKGDRIDIPFKDE